jgi:hypothetical protein
MLPSQRFSRSQGFSPPTLCRPYFMPVPPLGFRPPGPFDVRRSIDSLEPLYPLVVGRLTTFRCNRSGHDRFLGGSVFHPDRLRCIGAGQILPHFRVLLPASDCSSRSTYSLGREASTLLGFLLPRVFSPHGGFPRNLTSLELFRRLRVRRLPFRGFRGEIGLTLSSLPPLSRFATFSTFQPLHEFGVSGFPLEDRPALPLAASSLRFASLVA